MSVCSCEMTTAARAAFLWVLPGHLGAATYNTTHDSETLVTGASVLVAVFGLLVAGYYYHRNFRLSRTIADRAVKMEAQKLLLEINKALLADPSLFAIYKTRPAARKLSAASPELFEEKIKAFGFMMLNVFEIVLAQLPPGPERDVWTRFFRNSLDLCPVLGDLLTQSEPIYGEPLRGIYLDWRANTSGTDKSIPPTPPS